MTGDTTNELAEFHDELRAVARDLLAPTSPLVTGGEPAQVDWPKLAQAGWPGLEVPEADGGAGASFAEVAVVLEELGRAAAASPFLGTVLAVGALGLVEPSAGRDGLLAGIATGHVVATVAVPTGAVDLDAGRLPFVVERVDGAVHLAGNVPFVPDAPDADRILVVADDAASGGPVLVDLARGAGLAVETTPVIDASRSFGAVVADGAPVAGDRCWRLTGDPHDLLVRGALAVAVDSINVAGASDADAAVSMAKAHAAESAVTATG